MPRKPTGRPNGRPKIDLSPYLDELMDLRANGNTSAQLIQWLQDRNVSAGARTLRHFLAKHTEFNRASIAALEPFRAQIVHLYSTEIETMGTIIKAIERDCGMSPSAQTIYKALEQWGVETRGRQHHRKKKNSPPPPPPFNGLVGLAEALLESAKVLEANPQDMSAKAEVAKLAREIGAKVEVPDSIVPMSAMAAQQGSFQLINNPGG